MKYKNIMEALESGNKVTTKNLKEKYIQKTEYGLIDENGFVFNVQILVDNEILKVSDLFSEWYDYEEPSIELKLKKYLSIEFPNYADYFKTNTVDRICKEIIKITKPQD